MATYLPAIRAAMGDAEYYTSAVTLGEAARLIDSAYVITYRPKRPLADAPAGEARRIEIASRRVGLHLQTRQRYIVSENTKPRRTGN